MTRIAILDYGMGNLRSVARAVKRVGGEAIVTGDAAEVLGSDALVVPGVGHFGACMANLTDRGLDLVVRKLADGDRPVFGICLGMQVFLEGSEEDPASGLGLLPGVCLRLPNTVKVPHMGWNTVTWLREHPYVTGLPQETRFYFVHSYAPAVIDVVTVGATEHGRPFASVIAKDNVFATQFHPEKSGDAGLQIYGAFVEAAAG